MHGGICDVWNVNVLGQNIDHAYYTSKIYGPGDAAATGLWVNVEEMKRDEGKTQGFLTSTHRQAEVQNQCTQKS